MYGDDFHLLCFRFLFTMQFSHRNSDIRTKLRLPKLIARHPVMPIVATTLAVIDSAILKLNALKAKLEIIVNCIPP